MTIDPAITKFCTETSKEIPRTRIGGLLHLFPLRSLPLSSFLLNLHLLIVRRSSRRIILPCLITPPSKSCFLDLNAIIHVIIPVDLI